MRSMRWLQTFVGGGLLTLVCAATMDSAFAASCPDVDTAPAPFCSAVLLADRSEGFWLLLGDEKEAEGMGEEARVPRTTEELGVSSDKDDETAADDGTLLAVLAAEAADEAEVVPPTAP